MSDGRLGSRTNCGNWLYFTGGAGLVVGDGTAVGAGMTVPQDVNSRAITSDTIQDRTTVEDCNGR
jgi:hypothetical protein